MTATNGGSFAAPRIVDRRLGRHALALLGGLSLASASWSAPVRVMVSIAPQVAAARAVGGADTVVEVLVGPGQAAESFDPAPRQLARLQGMRVFVTVGMPFERPLRDKLATLAPALQVVDGTAGLQLQAMDDTGHKDAGHTHAGLDPHFWLDPRYMGAHARLIAEALARVDPTRAAAYAAREEAFEREMAALEGRLHRLLMPCSGQTLLVAHPAFGYLTRRYGLVQLALERDGKEPSARQLADLMDQARAAHVGAVFVQAQFPTKAADVLGETLGVPVIALDPLSADYVINLERMAVQLAATCGSGGARGSHGP